MIKTTPVTLLSLSLALLTTKIIKPATAQYTYLIVNCTVDSPACADSLSPCYPDPYRCVITGDEENSFGQICKDYGGVADIVLDARPPGRKYWSLTESLVEPPGLGRGLWLAAPWPVVWGRHRDNKANDRDRSPHDDPYVNFPPPDESIFWGTWLIMTSA
ncbi:hypothetical protein BO70DRAFT_393114 [Aspergillus heteromorphus CBS 117.55]|uniref:Uncharacterized protein n=1 Tax=Aspergillus heteromorphus CBS 117.55 TaxID=1448321 RepID=A0A317WVQ9_9EURO|nr:uncharacterized protein BO70DRAFT_393114 [Aspergillus heteromorphus CBS 117.55]PWY89921.1 hypothetical protein BO70DRAFT_393114 [Aspergillus heteromorphus CBS 117.55]